MTCGNCGEEDVELDQHNLADCFRILNERIEQLEGENQRLKEDKEVLMRSAVALL